VLENRSAIRVRRGLCQCKLAIQSDGDQTLSDVAGEG